MLAGSGDFGCFPFDLPIGSLRFKTVCFSLQCANEIWHAPRTVHAAVSYSLRTSAFALTQLEHPDMCVCVCVSDPHG